MLKRCVSMCACALVLVASAVAARADESPTDHGPMTASENAFVHSIQADLGARFAHPADAVKAGYVRYTNEDDSGAISYANRHWVSSDPRHPSQLWYDKNGNLLGADYTLPATDKKKRPHVFGVNPGRWFEFDDHVHWVGTDAKGKATYDNYVMAPDYMKGGGDPHNPSPADLVKMGKAKSVSSVRTIFEFPSSWDLVVWVKPNPSGAFNWKNPLVKP